MRQSKQNNLFLVGLMGSGKSTLGRILALRLGKTFFDQDAEIEKEQQRSIANIFAAEGEAFFRDVEEAYLSEFVKRENSILATGGGVVLRARNREMLRAFGLVIYLDVPLKAVVARLSSNFAHRPLLEDGSAIKKRIESLYAARDHLYRETAHIIYTGKEGETLAQSVTRVIERIKNKEKHES